MGQIGVKLAEALETKNNDLNLLTWKGPKEDVNGQRVQSEIKLMDATKEQLQSFYDHCCSMLYSTDKVNPGRIVLLNIIKDQRERCNTELYLRFLENAYLPSDRSKLDRFTYMSMIREVMDKNKDLFPKDKLDTILITSVTRGVPNDFSTITIDYVLDGCLDKLGIYNKKHLTLNFITKLGFWFTPQEKREFEEESRSCGKPVMDIVKERCGLKQITNIKTTPKGLLNFKEFRAMITLRNKKYSEMTTDQLLTLRNKVLFALEDEVEYHAKSWKQLIQNILDVAKSRGITLDT